MKEKFISGLGQTDLPEWIGSGSNDFNCKLCEDVGLLETCARQEGAIPFIIKCPRCNAGEGKL